MVFSFTRLMWYQIQSQQRHMLYNQSLNCIIMHAQNTMIRLEPLETTWYTNIYIVVSVLDNTFDKLHAHGYLFVGKCLINLGEKQLQYTFNTFWSGNWAIGVNIWRRKNLFYIRKSAITLDTFWLPASSASLYVTCLYVRSNMYTVCADMLNKLAWVV